MKKTKFLEASLLLLSF